MSVFEVQYIVCVFSPSFTSKQMSQINVISKGWNLSLLSHILNIHLSRCQILATFHFAPQLPSYVTIQAFIPPIFTVWHRGTVLWGLGCHGQKRWYLTWGIFRINVSKTNHLILQRVKAAWWDLGSDLKCALTASAVSVKRQSNHNWYHGRLSQRVDCWMLKGLQLSLWASVCSALQIYSYPGNVFDHLTWWTFDVCVLKSSTYKLSGRKMIGDFLKCVNHN